MFPAPVGEAEAGMVVEPAVVAAEFRET